MKGKLSNVMISSAAVQMPTDWTEVIAAVAARTVHVALLPYDTTLEKLAKYFSKHGQVNQVRLLKYSDMDGSGVFRGAALVEMSSAEEASVLLDLDLPYEGASLRVQTKASYEDLLDKVRKTSCVVDANLGTADLKLQIPPSTMSHRPWAL